MQNSPDSGDKISIREVLFTKPALNKNVKWKTFNVQTQEEHKIETKKAKRSQEDWLLF